VADLHKSSSLFFSFGNILSLKLSEFLSVKFAVDLSVEVVGKCRFSVSVVASFGYGGWFQLWWLGAFLVVYGDLVVSMVM